MNKPKAVLFDFGDTLCNIETFDSLEGTRRCLAYLEGDPSSNSAEEVQRVADRFNSIIKPLRETAELEHSAQCFQNLLYDYLDLSFSISGKELEREFWAGAEKIKRTDGVIEMLENLRSRDIPLGVVSNTAFCGDILIANLQNAGIDEYFDVVISSADYGIRKPNTLLFEFAAKRMNLDTGCIWFVGDKCAYDILGANNSGMTSVWYNPLNESATVSKPDYTVKHWREFTSLIDAAD